MASVEFYDVKVRKKVKIDEKNITKTKFTTKNGQTRYGLRAQTKEFLDKSGCYFLYKPIQFLDFANQVQAVLSDEAKDREK